MATDTVKTFWTPRETAAYLGISETSARALIAREDIASYRVGGLIRIRPADVEAYLESCRVGPKAKAGPKPVARRLPAVEFDHFGRGKR